MRYNNSDQTKLLIYIETLCEEEKFERKAQKINFEPDGK